MEGRKLLDSLGRESVMFSLRENCTALLSSNRASGGLRTISGRHRAVYLPGRTPGPHSELDVRLGTGPNATPTSCENNRTGQVRYADAAGGKAAEVRQSPRGCRLRANGAGWKRRFTLTMASILEGIDSPEQVRQLSLSEIKQVGGERRDRR